MGKKYSRREFGGRKTPKVWTTSWYLKGLLMLVGNTNYLEQVTCGVQHVMLFLSLGDITLAFVLHLPAFSHSLKRKKNRWNLKLSAVLRKCSIKYFSFHPESIYIWAKAKGLMNAKLSARWEVLSGVSQSLWPRERGTHSLYLRLEGGCLLRERNNQSDLLFSWVLSSLVCSGLSGVVKLNSGELQAPLQLWSAIQGNTVPEVNEPSRRHAFIQFSY